MQTRNSMTIDCFNAAIIERSLAGVIAVDARKVTAYQNAKVGAAVEGRPIVIAECEE
jgi:hypothetical protein